MCKNISPPNKIEEFVEEFSFSELRKFNRPTLVLLDNLLKDDTAKPEFKREQVKSAFRDVVIPIGIRDSNILVVGTILHEEDLMSDLQDIIVLLS